MCVLYLDFRCKGGQLQIYDLGHRTYTPNFTHREGRKTKYIWEYVKPEKKKSLLISASQQP